MKNKKCLVILVLIILSFNMVACKTSYEDDDVKYLMGIALHKMQENVDKKDEIVVIDTRSKEEYDQGHIKHAISIPKGELKENLHRLESFKEDPIIVYEKTSEEAEKTGQILFDAGFKDVSNADGVNEYDYDLYEYENILPEDMIEKIGDNSKVIIDARPSEVYKEGHIEGAINIPLNELEEKKQLLPTDKSKDITVYCFKGNNSSVLSQKLVDMGYKNVHSQLYGTIEYDYKLKK